MHIAFGRVRHKTSPTVMERSCQNLTKKHSRFRIEKNESRTQNENCNMQRNV